MANKYNNFKKFGKLASIIKKLSDKNPDLKNKILEESKSTSSNSWNKIQNWSSEFLFPKLKEKPLRFFTQKNISKYLEEKFFGGKPSSCFDVFQIPTVDLGRIDPFELEETLLGLPPNLQVQIDFNSGNSDTNTGIKKIEQMDNLGNGKLTTGIRNLYPNIDNVKFIRMRKKGAKEGAKNNCAYFVKIMFEDDVMSPEEEMRRVDVGIALKDLTPKQRKERLELKRILKEKEREKKFKIKNLDTPKNVGDVKQDEKIKKLVDETEALEKLKKDKSVSDKVKKSKTKDFNESLKLLKESREKGFITDKQFSQAFDKLVRLLRKGGQI